MVARIEELTSEDQSVLWEALYIALWDPPEEPRRPKSCLQDPNIAAYAADWGTQDTDLGFKSLSDKGQVQGVVWCRLIPDRADAHWDERTPQLGLAVFPDFQGQGLGRRLMAVFTESAVSQIPGVSLGVHPKNNVALKLYEKFGFTTFAHGPKGYLYMHRLFE